MRTFSLKLAGAALISAVVFNPAVRASDFGPLISAEELASSLVSENLLIVDIRGEKADDGVVPGSVSVGYGAFRGPTENPGKLVTEAQLTDLFQRLGVTADRPTVVVYQGMNETDFGAAARVYWTLKSAGVSNLAILNGGMNAWKESDSRPIKETAAEPVASNMTVTFSDTWLATRENVLAVVNGDEEAQLLDARPEEFHAGQKKHPAAARPGTLPQSNYFTHTKWFKGGATIINADAAQTLATEGGFNKEDKLVSFCNTGHWAATNWFALSELAGIDSVKLYPESLVGWSHAGLPMDNTPSVFKNLLNKVNEAI